MVKVIIEDSNGVNVKSGSAVFAIVPNSENTRNVSTIICADGELNKKVIAIGLAELVNNAIGAVSKNDIEMLVLSTMFLEKYGQLVKKRVGSEKSNNPLDDLMEILRKEGI